MLAKSQFFFLRNVSISNAASKSSASKLNVVSNVKMARNRLASSMRLPLIKPSKIGTPTKNQQQIRRFGTTCIRRNTDNVASDVKNATKTFSEAYKAEKAAKGPGKRPRPLNSSKGVGYWLVGSAGFVFAIVVLGGLTRLTESGLSITEWKPVTGSIPPMNEDDWLKEYELYKASPEFQILNTNMTLSEFKFIYYMEWTHRLWGRLLGLCFVLPAGYFVWARKTSAHTTGRLVLISGLIGLQGLIGWWMVKSGLDQDFIDKPNAHPRVSQYRLATHLGAAFLLYIAMINTGIQIVRESNWVKNPQMAMKEFSQLSNPAIVPFRRTVAGLVGLIFCTAMTGAFVAGLDAGLIYNSFPYMGENIVPPKGELMDPLYASDKSSNWNVLWKNCLENPTTVQFIHRCMAVTTYFAVFGMHIYSLRRRHVIPKPAIRAGGYCFLFVNLQVALGWTTLIYVVPTPLASLHQAGSMALLTAVLFLAARLKLPRSNIRYLVSALSQKAAKKPPL